MNEIVTNKIQSIQRCIERAREEYQRAGELFGTDYSRQDAAVLNVTRACEQTIDLANHVIKTCKMGIPTSSSESFALLTRKGVISSDLELRMEKMVGFRNIAVHEYRKLKVEIIEAVIEKGLDDLTSFAECVRRYLSQRGDS